MAQIFNALAPRWAQLPLYSDHSKETVSKKKWRAGNERLSLVGPVSYDKLNSVYKVAYCLAGCGEKNCQEILDWF